MIVLDDHDLFAALARHSGGQPMSEGPEQLFTTSSWYDRLTRAAHDPTFVGALSRRMKGLTDVRRTDVLDMLDALPEPW